MKIGRAQGGSGSAVRELTTHVLMRGMQVVIMIRLFALIRPHLHRLANSPARGTKRLNLATIWNAGNAFVVGRNNI
jgi:hypothetical protein